MKAKKVVTLCGVDFLVLGIIFACVGVVRCVFAWCVPACISFGGALVCAVVYMYEDAAEYERTRRTTTEQLNK